MAGRYGKKARKLPIEQLAIQQLTVHKNDKSMSIRARMNRTFGRVATQKALQSAVEILEMCDPNFKLSLAERNRLIGF